MRNFSQEIGWRSVNPNGCGDRISTNDGKPYWSNDQIQYVIEQQMVVESERNHKLPPLTRERMRFLANNELYPHVSEEDFTS